MSAPAFTPGPWRVYDATHPLGVETAHDGDPTSGHVCTLEDLGDDTMATARLIAAAPDLLAVAQVTLLFHSGSPWTPEKAAEWKRLTGGDDATTKALCDFTRDALAKVQP